VVYLLGCSISCGPGQVVDRAQIVTDARTGADPDATGGTGGSGGSGGLDGSGGHAGSGGLGGTGGTPAWDGASDGEPGPPPVDASASLDASPDVTAQPDSSSPDTASPPPDASPDTGPTLPFVSVSHAPGAGATDLTAAGSYDWRHWGYNASSASNRKRNGPASISMAPIGTLALSRYNDRPVRMSWSDGSPTLSVSSTADGIVVGDETGRGFELRVVGDPTRTRTIRAHVGVWGARARMAVALSTQSGSPLYVDASLTASDPGADRIYIIEFQPAVQTQALVLRWTVDYLFTRYGNVTLQAVTVSE
jgi:hypothetical protein